MDVVLVPGLWLTGDCWSEVVPVLEAAGHRAHPVTLPGTGSADPGSVTLQNCVDTVLGAAPGDGPLVLVGHSAAGGVVWAAADQAVDRVHAVVLVAAFPAPDGEPIMGMAVVDGALPPPDLASSFDEAELRDTDVSALQARLVASPGCFSTDPVHLTDDRRNDLPVTVVSTEYDTAQLQAWVAAGEQPVAEFPRLRHATYVDLPTGHWPQLTRPAELGELLVAAADGSATR